MRTHHREGHQMQRIGWLRAAVLGANDGIVSNASLILGVASASGQSHDILVAGTAALVAGALSMAAGEYVSVHAQADSERVEIEREGRELREHPNAELAELAAIHVKRGLDPELAQEVARQLMAHDALAAHTRDELGISEPMRARPLQAALASAGSFASGAVLPLLVALLTPSAWSVAAVAFTSLLLLALLGALAARIIGAPLLPSTARICFWGALAMAITAASGMLLGTSAMS